VFAVLAVVALVSQATALKCYQAPKSWDACWTDPSGMPWDHPRSFRGDSRFMVNTLYCSLRLRSRGFVCGSASCSDESLLAVGLHGG